MFDTVVFKMIKGDVFKGCFYDKITPILSDFSEHNFKGRYVVMGNLDNLKVTVSDENLKITGSLCKWFLGNNYKTLTRRDAQQAIEKLSDTFNLPMSSAKVTRIDIADNVILKNPIDVYFNHLGLLRYFKRLEEPDGLYYATTKMRLCFYDKIKELRNNGDTIPEIYEGANVMRYEMRLLKPQGIISANLYEERQYMEFIKLWEKKYNEINKINSSKLNFEDMKTIKDLQRYGLMLIAQQAGGELAFYKQLDEASKTGKLTKKQKYDIKRKFKDVFDIVGCNGETTDNEDIIKELNDKIKRAVKFYR